VKIASNGLFNKENDNQDTSVRSMIYFIDCNTPDSGFKTI